MCSKHNPERRGGLHSHQARSQNTIPSDGPPSNRAISGPQMQNTVTLPQRSVGVVSTQPSLQQQQVVDDASPTFPQLITNASSSNLQHESNLSAEGVPPQQQYETEDPPSSGELPRAYWGPSDTPMLEDDPADSEMEDPGTEKGRKTTKAPKAIKKKESRINVTLDTHGVFVDKKVVNKIIAHRVKYYFEPSYTSWGKVPRGHRELLWREFGMACKWDPELQERIARQWNTVNSTKYRDMMQKARQSADKGKIPKWMEVRHYWKCVRYWKTPDFVEISKRNSINRGVEYDDTGKVVTEAKATHVGGSKSIYDRGDSLLAFIETRVDSNKGKEQAADGCSTEGHEASTEGESLSNNAEEYLNDKDQAIVNNYRKNLEFLASEDRPSDSEPRNPIAWAMAVGGAKRGRVLGVSSEADPQLLGYPTTKRQALHVPNLENVGSGMNKETNQKLKEQIRSEIMQEIQVEMDKKLQEQLQIALASFRQQQMSIEQHHELHSEKGGEERTEGNEEDVMNIKD